MTDPVVLSDEVRAALAAGSPVVALETSVVAQGLPKPRNLEAATAMGRAIRDRGAVPAWIGVDRWALRIGLSEGDLARFGEGTGVAKVARRDLPVAVARGGPGATTVSATLWAAHRAGIEVAATGGIGGVHPGGGDVSADLLELGRTPALLVCSGPKSIVDPGATLERLEELGVAVLGYRCSLLPAFLVRETDLPLEDRVDSPAEAAAVARARRDLGIQSALLLCNPVPREAAMAAEDVRAAVAECEARAEREGVRGREVTPFLLSCLAERTGGASVEANVALLASNAGLAAEIAVGLAHAA